MIENKDNEGQMGNQAKIITLAVIVFIILGTFLVFLLRNNNQEGVSESDAAASESQTDANGADPTSEPSVTTPTDSEPITGAEEDAENRVDDKTGQTPPPDDPIDARLPDNWNQLSSREKTAANPHGCYEGSVIRADNGRCVVPGTSINYIPLTIAGPHAYFPGLVGYQPIFRYVGVPDNTSDTNIDKLFEYFRSLTDKSDYLGVPTDIILDRLEVYYYSDFNFDDEAWHGIDIDYESARRVYLIHPRHYFRVFDFAGYRHDNEGKSRRVYEEGRNGSLPTGCEAAVDISLLYRSAEISLEDKEFEEGIDVVYYYGPSSVTAADLRAAIINDQGQLESKFRGEILMSLGLANIGQNPDERYDIQLRIYRYDSDKGNDFDLYGAGDAFMPDIHIVEYSG